MTQTNPHNPEASAIVADNIAAVANRLVLADPALLPDPSLPVFSLSYWRSQAAVTGTAAGRGSVWFVQAESGEWALRHYRRGGLVGRLIEDHYLWTGQAQVRAFAEWRLLAILFAAGMPVPRPVAAAYVREGLFYTCDLITQRLANTRTLAALIGHGEIEQGLWHEVGRVTRQFHALGVDHADLNAHNILIDADARVFLIDFDRARQRQPGNWQQRNLARLKRSLLKVGPESARKMVNQGWQEIAAGYVAEQDQEA